MNVLKDNMIKKVEKVKNDESKKTYLWLTRADLRKLNSIIDKGYEIFSNTEEDLLSWDEGAVRLDLTLEQDDNNDIRVSYDAKAVAVAVVKSYLVEVK